MNHSRRALTIVLLFLAALLLLSVCQANVSDGMPRYPSPQQQKHIRVHTITRFVQLPSRGGHPCARIITKAPSTVSVVPLTRSTVFWNKQTARWCYDGQSVIVSRFDDTERWTAWWTSWGWKADADPVDGPLSGDGSSYRYHRREHDWGMCVLWYCITRTTRIEQTVRADGSYAARGYLVP